MGRPQFLEEWIDGATICRESSAVGFVWSMYEGCLNFFAKLVPLVSERRSTASANKILNEEVGRLLSWGDGFDNGELDRTLERDPELKSTTLEYLSSLGTLLTNKLFVVPIFNNVGGRAELEIAAVELRSLVANARTIIDDSEDDTSDLESDTGAKPSNKRGVLDEIASDIKFYNLRLMELLPSIERTALARKDMQAAKVDTTPTSIPFQVSRPAYAYVLQVRDKFPEADKKLIERLGEANWQRRVRIREEPQEFAEVVGGETAKSIFMPVSMFHDSGLGTSVPTQSAYALTAASHSSFRTTATENQVGTYRVPRTPKGVFDGVPFACEICGHVLRNIKNRVDWKIHVFADLKPYICTFPLCQDELCTFPTRQLWADHEFREHRVEKAWRCYLCPTQMSSPVLWDDHVKQVHGTNLSREQYQKTILVCEISKEPSAEALPCPLCQKVEMKTRKDFVIHVAKHMESIALAALPRDAESDSGSDVEMGTNSAEGVIEAKRFATREASHSSSISGGLNDKSAASPDGDDLSDVAQDVPRSPYIEDEPLDQFQYRRPTVHLDLSLDENRHISPPYTYLQLISQAILESPDKQVTLTDIYNYCMKNYAFFRQAEHIKGWQSSIRHNILLNKEFKFRERESHEAGKGVFWSFKADFRDALVANAWGGEISRRHSNRYVSDSSDLRNLSNHVREDVPGARPSNPPVLASTPTLPPKPMRPQHSVTDSAAVKSQEQIRLEVKESMKRVDEADVKAASSPISSNQLSFEVHPSSRTTFKVTSSYWTLREREEFLDLIAFYGEDWNAIANHMGSKTPLQVQNYYQRENQTANGSDMRDLIRKATIRQISSPIDAKKFPSTSRLISSPSDSADQSTTKPPLFPLSPKRMPRSFSPDQDTEDVLETLPSNERTDTRSYDAQAGEKRGEQKQQGDHGNRTKTRWEQDRWAQIRKYATERAAQTTATGDDGETSGEETIESRVARIKARVAELTANIEKSEAIHAQDQVEREQTPADILDNASITAEIGGDIDDVVAYQGPFSSGKPWTRDCNQCSLSKGRCDKANPICGSCRERSLACSFEPEAVYDGWAGLGLDENESEYLDNFFNGVGLNLADPWLPKYDAISKVVESTAPDIADEQARTRGLQSKLGELLSPESL